MAGTFPGVCNSQQNDINGLPLASAILTVYAGGTTTLAATYQDIGLALPAPNPLVADASGRLPLFFVADGSYGLRLTDQNGVQGNGGFFLAQVPSIGASSSGGGGSVVDPTTVFSTGDVKWRLEQSTIAGWVRIAGKTIGNASSGASERANADCQALFIYVWQTYADAICPVVGGRGGSALADFSAGKQITLLDARDRTILGLDDMGNAALGGLGAVPFTTGNATTGGSSGGEAAHALITAELAQHSHANTLNDPSHFHQQNLPVPGGGGTWNSISGSSSSTLSGYPSTLPAVTGITINNANAGSGNAHNNTPLFLLGTLFWKL